MAGVDHHVGGKDEPELGARQEARLVGRQRGEHAQTRTQIDFFT